MTLEVPDWIWNRIDHAIDRLAGAFGAHDDAPRLPLKAAEWDVVTRRAHGREDPMPPDGEGWWLLGARAVYCEGSGIASVFTYARRKPAKEST